MAARPTPALHSRTPFRLCLAFLALAHRPWSAPPSVAAADSDLDEKSLAMANRIVRKARDEPDAPPSWGMVIEVLENSFLGAGHEEGDFYRSSPREAEARERALRWLAHEDGSPSALSEDGYDRGLLQRYALATIYHATGGDDWTRCSRKKTSPDQPDSVCESDDKRHLSPSHHLKWDGINGKDGRATWLDLSGRGLVSPTFLPLELTLLSPSLELLWVSENEHLGGTLPNYLHEFQSLVSLSAYKTSVSGSIPLSIYSLPKLNSIRLYKSKFEGTISSHIGKLSGLKWLWIHDNDFTGSVPDEIGKLAKLEGVTLHGNRFAHGVESNNVVPESLCKLKGEILKHIWTDCERGSLVPAAGDSEAGRKLAVREGARACVCCTRCFPRGDDAAAIADG